MERSIEYSRYVCEVKCHKQNFRRDDATLMIFEFRLFWVSDIS